jgi:phage shock protein C
MYCTKCGIQLRDDDHFCSRCGTPTRPDQSRVVIRSPLSRPMDQKKIAGVCAGFARYMDVDVTLMRILWLAVALCTGMGFIAYLVAWILMPKDYPAPAAAPQPAAQRA